MDKPTTDEQQLVAEWEKALAAKLPLIKRRKLPSDIKGRMQAIKSVIKNL